MDYNEFNYQLEQLKSKIFQVLNNSQMPIGAIYYLFKDIYNDLTHQYIASVNSYSMGHSSVNEQVKTVSLEEEKEKTNNN